VTDRAIFRESALAAYRRGAGNDVLPRLVSRRTVACAWILLVIVLATVALAWFVRVPSYVSGQGVVVPATTARDGNSATRVALFLPPQDTTPIRTGQPARVVVLSLSPIRATVVQVESDVAGPDAAERRLGLPEAPTTGPSRVVLLRLARSLPARYVASSAQAQVETGSQRALSLVPGLHSLVGQ